MIRKAKGTVRPIPQDGPLSGPLIDAIRRELAAGKSLRQIALAAGVTTAMVSRFVNGERAPDLRTLDRLLPVLGLEIRPGKKYFRKPAVSS